MHVRNVWNCFDMPHVSSLRLGSQESNQAFKTVLYAHESLHLQTIPNTELSWIVVNSNFTQILK